MHFPEPQSCRDMSEEMFAFYSQSADLATRLLDQMVRIAVPYDGEAYLLSFLSRVVMRSWLPGEISLTIVSLQNYVASFTLVAEHEDNDPEIIYQNDFNVSIATILDILAMENSILPFEIEHTNSGNVVLIARQQSRYTTLPPSEFSYADAEIETPYPDGISLFAQTKAKKSDSKDSTGVYLRPPPLGTLIAVMNTADETIYEEARRGLKE